MDIRWRIPEPIEVNHRRIVDTGGKPLFAKLHALLTPSDSPDGVKVEEKWEDARDSRWLPAIQTAVDQFVAWRKESGSPVGFTTLVMLRVISYEIDTDDRAVIYQNKSMLHDQFAVHETSEIRDQNREAEESR